MASVKTCRATWTSTVTSFNRNIHTHRLKRTCSGIEDLPQIFYVPQSQTTGMTHNMTYEILTTENSSWSKHWWSKLKTFSTLFIMPPSKQNSAFKPPVCVCWDNWLNFQRVIFGGDEMRRDRSVRPQNLPAAVSSCRLITGSVIWLVYQRLP